MSKVTIEVVRDPASSKPGEAILRLVGLFDLPASPVFRVEPLDEDAARTPPRGWPTGDLTPRAMRVGETGVELLIGADVVDAPSLRPGTPVAISVPAANLRRELRWPTLPMPRAERRGAVVVSGEKRAADLAARAEAQRAELARITAARLEAERQDREAAEAMLAARLVAAAEKGTGATSRSAEPAALSLVTTHGSAPEPHKSTPQLRVVPPPLPDAGERAGETAPATAPPPLPSATVAIPDGAAAVKTPAAPVAGVAAGTGLPAGPETSPVGDVSASDILARQMSKREAPSRALASSLYKAFAMGFVVSGALAYAASLFLPDDDGLNRRRADESARQLMIEADGLRQRLTAEAEARRTSESNAAKRVAAVEAERDRLGAEVTDARRAAEAAQAATIERDKLAGDVAELKKQVEAKGDALQQAQSEVARLREASDQNRREREQSDRQRSDGEAAARTTSSSEIEALRKSLAEAEARVAAAEQARAKLATEAEQLRGRLGPTEAARTSAAPQPQAGTVVLKVKGSDFEVSGKLKSFDGQRYVIEAPGAGPMTLDAARVDCSGEDCPKR